jgi:serine/threonine-protein kinase
VASISPTKIGKYDVEERVGEGAMGVVYRAVDPILKRRVAIKVMGEAFAQNDDLRERFLREAQAAGSLQHPNVITIYDFGEVDGHLYIAMEFVEGQDVAELLAHNVPLSLAAKLDIAIGVLQGLAFAHKRGIVHRDIKPANIRVDSEGNARIMDFGVAHFASSNMTRTGVMIGTPSYMAPEQITGGAVGPQSDIFSAGAVLYELLTGTSPFAGGSLQAVMYRVLSETPPSPGTSAPGLPPKLNEIVTRALAKEPGQRYASALDMANDLLAVRESLDDNPSSSHATLSLRATIESALDERRTSTFRRVRRRRFALGGGGVIAAAVLVFSGWVLAKRAGVQPPPVPAPANATPRAADTVASAPARTEPLTTTPRPEQPRERQRVDDRRTTDANSAASSQTQRTQAPASKSPAPATNPVANTPQPQPQASASQSQPPTGTTSGRADVTPAGSAQPVTANPPANSAASNQASNPPPNVPPATTSSAASPQTNAVPAPLPAAPSNTAAATAEIGSVIDAYARAIESRDVAELRRVYPTITGDQAAAFTEFFKSTRTLRASLAVKSARVDGTRGTAHVTGTYDFTTTAGRSQQQAVTFDADLRREGAVWKIVAVR